MKSSENLSLIHYSYLKINRLWPQRLSPLFRHVAEFAKTPGVDVAFLAISLRAARPRVRDESAVALAKADWFMPSPIGHGLAGMSTTWVTQPRARWSLAIAGAILAALPDVDVLFGGHRGSTHSLGAVALVSAVAAAFAALRRLPVARIAAVCGLAYASHLLLDWLGKDTAAPYGIMAFWPLSSRYYSSGANLFLEISRRYWKPDEFIVRNLKSIAWELALLLPVAALTYFLKIRRRKTEDRRQKTE